MEPMIQAAKPSIWSFLHNAGEPSLAPWPTKEEMQKTKITG
jgi:hypothetical protein